jgi:uncharacterized NAD(P)/FAD-binding protein YdhS
MSVNDDPKDFLSWLRSERRRRGFNWGANDFAPRQYFGEYLQARMKSIRTASNMQFSWVRSTADSVLPRGHGWEVIPAQGEPIGADIVVLATGNESPRPIGADLAPSAQHLILNDPWDADRKAAIARSAAILVVGTSLTAVDVVAEFLERRHSGPIIAFSRRGLVPRSHGASAAVAESLRRALPSSLSAILKRVRELTRDDPRGDRWRGVFTELRSMAPAVWAAWNLEEQQRFLRHVRPFWDVHRHRVAPSVHGRLMRAIERGQLTVLKGRLESLEHDALRASLRATLRHARGGPRIFEGNVLINCTGPQTHALKVANPLLQSVVADGIARPDALHLGLATDARSRVIAGDGSVRRTLFALGTLARGSQWELTAVPEIREQARLVAREIDLHTAAAGADRGAARDFEDSRVSFAV